VITAGARGAYRELEARLRPFVARRVPSPADVDDVVQDVFLRMQRGLADVRDEDRFGPWVYRVARSAIADHRRARARHPLAAGDAPDVPVGPDDADEDGAVERMVATHIAPFVALLPSPYRAALTLTELEGISQRDAAAMLGVSISGMKSRVQRGRARRARPRSTPRAARANARGRVIACEPRVALGAVPRAACACEPAASTSRGEASGRATAETTKAGQG
jgi:RNA polymerase sigma-70 factor (ECF subfamily)